MEEKHSVITPKDQFVTNSSVAPQKHDFPVRRPLTTVEKVRAQELYAQGYSLARLRHMMGLSRVVTLGRIIKAVRASK